MGRKYLDYFVEEHKIKNRVIIWYVRSVLLNSELKQKYEASKNVVDHWKESLSSEDLFIANMMLNGVTLADLDDFRDKCYREKKKC